MDSVLTAPSAKHVPLTEVNMQHAEYIIVQTTAGDLETLELWQVEQVIPVVSRKRKAHLCLRATPERPEPQMLEIRETAEAFERRLQRLKKALQSMDLQGINRHFAPLLDHRSRH